ncbi:MAG: hypothetical protein LIP03_09615 [Bacteroidales bacterium]|nr:hypothetical protein [Bacteroidales bacterium]
MNEQVPSQWRGYNFDDLRFNRVLSLTRIELEKHKIANDYQALMGNNGRAYPLFSRLSSAISYADYILIAFKLTRRVLRMFSKKKTQK